MSDTTESDALGDRLFYDGDCALCAGLVARHARALTRAGCTPAPLQTPEAEVAIGLSGPELLSEMRLVTSRGRHYGGADAFIHLAGKLWWTRPLAALAILPGVRPLLRAIYRRVAARRRS